MQQRKDLTQRTHQTGLHPIKLLALLGKTWLRQGLWNVLMGHILDLRRVTCDSQMPTVIAYYQIGRELSETGLLYSKKANEEYCFTCKLFGGAKTCDKRPVLGYNNWQCLSKTLQLHETSNLHIDSYLSWKEWATRLQLGKTLFQAFPKHQDL